jgi:hypothetical protein
MRQAYCPSEERKKVFLVKVCIATNKLQELGEKLRDGSLDTSAMAWTYCHKEDPSVGVSLWEATDKTHFEKLVAPMKEFCAEVLETTPVITSTEAQAELIRLLSP